MSSVWLLNLFDQHVNLITILVSEVQMNSGWLEATEPFRTTCNAKKAGGLVSHEFGVVENLMNHRVTRGLWVRFTRVRCVSTQSNLPEPRVTLRRLVAVEVHMSWGFFDGSKPLERRVTLIRGLCVKL